VQPVGQPGIGKGDQAHGTAAGVKAAPDRLRPAARTSAASGGSSCAAQ
jgi:hypothetical protein